MRPIAHLATAAALARRRGPAPAARFVGPGQILDSGAAGRIQLDLDPGALPQGAGTVAALAGESWHFQAWFRDGAAGSPGQLTDSVSVRF